MSTYPMDFIVTVTVQKRQISKRVVAVLVVPVMHFEMVFRHETQSALHTTASLGLVSGFVILRRLFAVICSYLQK